MSVHMTWGLIGFGIALLFFAVYQILRARGVRFFWYHPIFAGLFLLLILYILESFFSDLSASEMTMNWDIMFYIGLPVLLIVGLLLYRAVRRFQRSVEKK